MDYNTLALEYLRNLLSGHRTKLQNSIDEALQGENFILSYIARHGDDLNPGEIGRKMNVSTARIAAALNNLEKKGLITRQIDMNNRSKILVRITQEGKELVEEHWQTVVDGTVKMLEFLGEQDAKEYVRIKTKLAEFHPECKKVE